MEISTALELATFTEEMRNRLIFNSFNVVNDYILQRLQELHPMYNIQSVSISTPENSIRIIIRVAVDSVNEYPINEFRNDIIQLD